MITADYRELQLNSSVIALGKFQGLHLGHLLLIDEVKRLSEENDIPGVVFTINMSEEKVINTDDERISILENCGIAYKADCDFTKEFAAIHPEEFIRDILVDRFHAAYVVVGEDFCFGAGRAGNVNTLKEYGTRYGYDVIAFPKLKLDGHIISTTYIRELIGNGRMEEAAAMMGRPYAIMGTVQSGKRLGRTIGFPTANIIPYERKLLPKKGVYKTRVYIDGISYTGMTNVGENPTVNNGNEIFVETHIIDFDGDIYGDTITVEFLSYVREQLRFNSIDELKEQLKKDKTIICR